MFWMTPFLKYLGRVREEKDKIVIAFHRMKAFSLPLFLFL